MLFDKTKSVWYERYKPQRIEDLIVPEQLKSKIQRDVLSQDIPNLGLFSSEPGTGKSSTAHAIIKSVNGEALWINGSLEKGIEILRGKIQRFASSTSFDDKIKIVVMDEFDRFSADGQFAFRGFLDEFSQNCRFIFTGNYKGKIIVPLLDRLEVYDFESFKKEDMVRPIFNRLKFILENEKINYDPKDLVKVINNYYPRIRSMVGALQKFTNPETATLVIDENTLDDTNTFGDLMGLVKPQTFMDMVTAVNKLNAPNNMYTYMYRNAAKHFKSTNYPKVILIIARFQHMSETVRDKHLNLSACLSELMYLTN